MEANLRRKKRKVVRLKFEDFLLQPPSNRSHIKLHLSLLHLLRERFDIKIVRDPDFLIYSHFGRNHLKYDCTKIFYTGELRHPKFQYCDYAFTFDYLDDERHHRLPIYRLYKEFGKLDEPRRNHKRKFCNFAYSNPFAHKRIKLFHKLNQYKTIQAIGKVFNPTGPYIKDKAAFLRKFKFTIAFENQSSPGYTTEKILHAFAARTVPIYWGNPRIGEEFDPSTFINCHDYDDFDRVVERVIEVDQNDDLYEEYFKNPPYLGSAKDDREAILNKFENIFSSHV